jgi:hypothetical protein
MFTIPHRREGKDGLRPGAADRTAKTIGARMAAALTPDDEWRAGRRAIIRQPPQPPEAR